MPQPFVASSLPLANVSRLKPDGDGLGFVTAEELLSVFGKAVRPLRKWLQPAELTATYGLAGHEAHIAVEMCHILGTLDKSVALCAAEADDKSQQELFIKCAFHWHRLRPTWSAICEHATGRPLDALYPLTSTLTFQLGLEELAKKDPLAFAYVIDLFGTPGNTGSIDGVANFIRALLPGPAVADTIEAWRHASLDNARSYASVDTAKPYGYPLAGSYGDTYARDLGGLLERDVEKSLGRIDVVADWFHLFYRGVQVFYLAGGATFPRPRVDWLEV